MRLKIEHWLLSKYILVGCADVPDANSAVVRSREKQALFNWVPCKSVAFLRVAEKTEVWLHLVVGGSFGVLEVVKEVNLSVRRLGRNNILCLWHIPRLVNFSLMINLNINRNPRLLCISNAIAPDSIRIVI